VNCALETCENEAVATVTSGPGYVELCRDHYTEWRDGDDLPRRFARAALQAEFWQQATARPDQIYAAYRESLSLASEKRRKAAAERDTYRAALAELVRLKDGPRNDAYQRDKPLAWARARALLQASADDYIGDFRKQPPTTPSGEEQRASGKAPQTHA
jgi:hypothetical protein